VATSLVVRDDSVDFCISAWLDEKEGRSGSKGTRTQYSAAMRSFRSALNTTFAMDLDGEERYIRLTAQAWAETPVRGSSISPATYNMRIGCISSFYEYCVRNDLGGIKANPMEKVQRREVQRYADARSLNREDVTIALNRIDRTTLDGKRDYALLVVALTTGRRLSEVTHLSTDHLEVREVGKLYDVTIHWPRAKGGKKMHDKLNRAVSYALMDYLAALPSIIAGGPLWISLSTNHTRFKPLSTQSVEDIAEKRLGTSKFHRLRHTFAHEMEQSGAKVSEIQAKLGHSSIATTGGYLTALSSDENPYADSVADSLGIR
jgi:site-specific recombinase XerD